QKFEDAWSEECTSIANATLFPKTDSWIFGANIPGKKHTVLFYLGGMASYRGVLDDVQQAGLRGFEVKSKAVAA
ncbi:MAG: NAD(P)/FAD-dependent oxidoreductase, partial [Alphaproteobacteria bacterium]